MADEAEDGWGNDPNYAQHVRIRLKLADGDWGTEEDERLWDLEEELERAIAAASVGLYDGNEIGLGFFDCFLYGPDAELLAAVAWPVVEAAKPRPGSHLVVRAGPPGTAEFRLDLDTVSFIDGSAKRQ